MLFKIVSESIRGLFFCFAEGIFRIVSILVSKGTCCVSKSLPGQFYVFTAFC